MVINVVQKSKYFSKEADVVLLCLTHEHGYGNWQQIKHALKRDTRCRFDHLFMSRTVQELQKRVDILVKSLEKEIYDLKHGLTGQPSNRRRNNEKKRESALAKNAASDVDEENALGDRAEIGHDQVMEEDGDDQMNGNVQALDNNYDPNLAEEMKVRLGGDDEVYDESPMHHNPEDEHQATMAGQKRPKREYTDEEDDMDFDAIQQ